MRYIPMALLSFAFLLAAAETCSAQGWPSWADEAFGRSSQPDRRLRPYGTDETGKLPHSNDLPRARNDLRDGGPRPEIAPVAPAIIAFGYDFPANSIVIDTGARKLFYVLPDKQAYQYSISVGREGFNWTGNETVSRKQAWPDWYPPAEMRERDTALPEKMTGGLKNPLGAMALYLGKTLYRIHGTNDVKSIGRAQSSGCFRMLNSGVMHLASLTEVGTSVTVVSSLPSGPQVSHLPDQPGAGVRQVPQQVGDQTQQISPSADITEVQDYQALRTFTLEKMKRR